MRPLLRFAALILAACFTCSASAATTYDARISDREILTPAAPAAPRFTGASIHGVRPGKPVRFRLSATGERPLHFTAATPLPDGLTLDAATGWLTGRAPAAVGDVNLSFNTTNAHGTATRNLTLRVGDEIALTPPMGWNSWYVHSEGVSDAAIRETAVALHEKALTDHGWTYLNIDDCWMGERDPQTLAIQPNNKFGDVAMNSFNHYAYGAINQWMVERLAGLAPDPAQPGYKNLLIRLLFAPQLNSARADLDTPYGSASSSWERRGNTIHLELQVPPNTTATLDLGPDSTPTTLTPGRHHIEHAL